MADEFNVSQSTYNNWENSNTQPSIEQLIALARFFGVSVDYLVGNSDDVGTISYISTLSPDERHILDVFSSLPSSLKTAFVAILNAVSDNDKYPVSMASHPRASAERG